MKRILIALGVLLMAALALSACGGGKPTPASAPPPAQPTVAATQAAPAQAPAGSPGAAQAPTAAAPAPAPTATQPPPTKAAPPPTATPAPTEEPLPVLKAGALKSYVGKIEMKIELAKPTPQVEVWSLMEIRYRGEPTPEAYELTISDKTGQNRGVMKVIQVGQDMYIQAGDEGDKWLKISRTDEAFGDIARMMVDPNELARETSAELFSKANVVNRRENVGGVETTHYRVSAAQLQALVKEYAAEGKLLSGQVDFYVANRGNYLKQYLQQLTVEDTQGRQRNQSLTLLVSDENKPVTIATPPPDKVETMPAMPAIPTMPPSGQPTVPQPGATPPAGKTGAADADVAALPEPPDGWEVAEDELPDEAVLMSRMWRQGGKERIFLSTAEADAIAKFYTDQLAARGYKAGPGTGSLPGVPINIYTYSKGSGTIQLVIFKHESLEDQVAVFIQAKN